MRKDPKRSLVEVELVTQFTIEWIHMAYKFIVKLFNSFRATSYKRYIINKRNF